MKYKNTGKKPNMVLDGEVGANSQNDTSPLEGKEVSDDSSVLFGLLQRCCRYYQE